MAKKPNKKKAGSSTIAQNKRARHDYFISEKFEAGVALMGWEVKSIRAGKCQLVDSYVLLKDGEAWLLGAHIEPMNSASTHVVADPDRSRKLLLNARELSRIFRAVSAEGYTCVALSIYWKQHLVKVEIGIAKGKKDQDKRSTDKERDWNRQKQRIVRQHNR